MSKPRKAQAKRRAAKNADCETARTHADEDPDVLLREASAACAAAFSDVNTALRALDDVVALYRDGEAGALDYLRVVDRLVATVRADEREKSLSTFFSPARWPPSLRPVIDQMRRYLNISGAS